MGEAMMAPNKPLEVTRREFLWWTAGAVASSQFGLMQAGAVNTRVGLVGLGHRGRTLLGLMAGTMHAKIDALCDVDSDRLLHAASSLRRRPALETEDATALCRARDLDLVVLAVPTSIQVELATTACTSGKDVFLTRPLSTDAKALHELAALAAERGRQVQVSRWKRLTMRPGSGAALIRADLSTIAEGELQRTISGPTSTTGDFGLIDELDFVLESAPATVVKLHDLGSPGSGPFRWSERRRHYALIGEVGSRRNFSVIERSSPSGSAETSTLRLSSPLGEVRIHSTPALDVGEPDLATMLALRRGSPALGLSLGRVVEISAHFSLELGS